MTVVGVRHRSLGGPSKSSISLGLLDFGWIWLGFGLDSVGLGLIWLGLGLIWFGLGLIWLLAFIYYDFAWI